MAKWQRALYQPNLPLGRGGKRLTACKEHILLSKEAAKEGMVLLKNEEEMLPFKTGTKLALFGKGTFDYVKGGGGSGDVTVEYIRNLYEGLKISGNGSIFEELADFYRKEIREQYKAGKEPGMTKEPAVSDELCENARKFTDTAIITICRFSGEGWDRKSTYDKVSEGTENKDDLFENGDFYLSDAEKAMVEKVKKYFDKIVVVLNVGGMVDTEWFKEDKKIKSALLALQGGMEGGIAAAELLFGNGTPSGKLSDTFAKRLEDYPSSYNFHESDDYVEYTEDIYVGYRYFETIPGAAEKVNYPFGYGLSYTTFDWEVVRAEMAEGFIKGFIEVKVTNTGKYPGKEVMELYVSAPQGVLGKAAKSLINFEKTKLLQPGQSQNISFEVSTDELASYDDLGKISKSSYVAEAGTYKFYVGNSVRNVKEAYDYELKENKIISKLSPKVVPTALSKRMLSDGTFEELEVSEGHDKNDTSKFGRLTEDIMEGITPAGRLPKQIYRWGIYSGSDKIMFEEVANGNASIEEFMSQLSDEEVAHLLGGQPNMGVANTCGIGNLLDYGVPSIMTADGPAGLRIEPVCGINTTAFPCATLLACTWNRDIVYEVGKAGAEEVKENNISMWLTPAVNIHRSPLCGRNFEYYSEDPVLTGMLAAEMVKGIQSQNVSASVKHFALNDKETNRKNSDSRVSERAAREIYLKAFEIIVKKAKPWCIMSSYNVINGYRASECKDLLTGILREEWGYEGLVTTDWWAYSEDCLEVLAGNDVKMPTGYPERLLKAVEEGVITRADMEICAKRVLELILKIN